MPVRFWIPRTIPEADRIIRRDLAHSDLIHARRKMSLAVRSGNFLAIYHARRALKRAKGRFDAWEESVAEAVAA